MENINSVCYIARINSIVPIVGADKIELASVGNWNSIVQKDIHKVGDLVLCLTQDAVLPPDFAEEHGIVNYLRKGNRVKTVKLKGVYSECILIPFREFQTDDIPNVEEGEDLMDSLGIFKYEEPIKQVQLADGSTKKYKDNPNFHIYYKFPNFKNASSIFDKTDLVVVTRKIHGTNARYGIVKKSKLSLWDKVKKFFTKDPWIDYDFVYGSHKVKKGSKSQGFYSTDVWRSIAETQDIEPRLWLYVKNNLTPSMVGSGLILHGEIFGAGIQKNYDYDLKGIDFIAFDIEINGEYLSHPTFTNIIDKVGFSPAEELYEGLWDKDIAEEFLTCTLKGTKIPHEGIVVKHISGDRKKVAKMISADYLVYADKHDVTDNH